MVPPTMNPRRFFSSKLVFALVCGLFTILLAAIPTVTLENEADLSLGAVINHAREYHLQFGKDIISTYGPLGFLIFPCYSAQVGAARLLVDLAMGFVVA